jgi:hypothetical protein
MTKIIELPKIKELEKVVFNPLVKPIHRDGVELKIMRIEKDDNYTRIDFIYNNGEFAWVQIQSDCFIRPVGSELKYPLIKSHGIPIAPNKHYFSSAYETLYYTLYFAAVPENVKKIDIIEKEETKAGHRYFNFYGVPMETVRRTQIEVGN